MSVEKSITTGNPKLDAAIDHFEDAVRESDEIIADCSPDLQTELTEQKGHFVVALEAMRRAPLLDNKVVEMVFGRGELGVATVAANEDAPLREVLIYRLPSPVLPISSSLGDDGKSVEDLENVLVRMHFENAESAHVLERAVRRVLGTFGEPDNKELTVEGLWEATEERPNMKRYTQKEQNFETQFCAGCGCDYYGEPDGCNHPNGACESYTYFTILADRLAAYKDTGLEPEEVPTGLELANVYAAMLLLKQYQSIGPVEEFRALKEAVRRVQL